MNNRETGIAPRRRHQFMGASKTDAPLPRFARGLKLVSAPNLLGHYNRISLIRVSTPGDPFVFEGTMHYTLH